MSRAGFFIGVWLKWTWLPVFLNEAMGLSIGWGPFLFGYIRSDEAQRQYLQHQDRDL